MIPYLNHRRPTKCRFGANWGVRGVSGSAAASSHEAQAQNAEDKSEGRKARTAQAHRFRRHVIALGKALAPIREVGVDWVADVLKATMTGAEQDAHTSNISTCQNTWVSKI